MLFHIPVEKKINLQCISFSQFRVFGFMVKCGPGKLGEKYFLSRPKKSLLKEKKKLHLGEINTSSGQSKMDDTSDPLNLLEQKVIRPLSAHSCETPTTTEGTRAACCGQTGCTSWRSLFCKLLAITEKSLNYESSVEKVMAVILIGATLKNRSVWKRAVLLMRDALLQLSGTGG